MKILITILRDLHNDRSGVSFIEYTALLGVILAAGLAVLTNVGTWAFSTWNALCTAMASTPGACVPIAS